MLDIENAPRFQDRIQSVAQAQRVEETFQPQFTSWFEQEIAEQPECLLRVTGNGARLACPEPDSAKLGG